MIHKQTGHIFEELFAEACNSFKALAYERKSTESQKFNDLTFIIEPNKQLCTKTITDRLHYKWFNLFPLQHFKA